MIMILSHNFGGSSRPRTAQFYNFAQMARPRPNDCDWKIDDR